MHQKTLIIGLVSLIVLTQAFAAGPNQEAANSSNSSTATPQLIIVRAANNPIPAAPTTSQNSYPKNKHTHHTSKKAYHHAHNSRSTKHANN